MKQIFSILFLPFFVLGQNTFLMEVQNQNNDLEVKINNTTDFTSSDLELSGKDGTSQESFIRFDGVSLPEDAKINSIQLIFYAKDNSKNSTTITIKGEIGNSPAYPTSTGAATGQNIKNRNYTTNSVEWKSVNSTANQEYRSPNLDTLIKEMFPKGLRNSNLSFRLTGNEQGVFTVHSYSNSNYRPKLFIDYWSEIGTISAFVFEAKDDARESDSGSMNTGSTSLYLGGQTDGKITGVRFQKVNIPNNSQIIDAYIEFFSYGASAKASINIFCEIANKEGYSTTSKSITNRKYSTEKILWDQPAIPQTEAKFRTPNLKNIIDEVRLRESATGSYAFMLIGSATDKGATMRSFEAEAAKAPRLVVEYKNNGAGPSIPGGISDTSLMNKIVLNEIAPEGTLEQKEDWIEIYNGHDTPIYSQGGIYLSNENSKRDKFEIKNFYIPAKGFLTFIADENVSQGRYNLNFKLKASGDVYLSRKNVDTIIEQDKYKYSEISFDESYGRKDDIGDFQLNSISTYSTTNKNGARKISLNFSHQRGLYNQSFSLTLTAQDGTNAKIKYTTNGSFPTENFGISYTNPINISNSTVIKAIAFGPGISSGIIFHSFILTNRNGQNRLRGGITDSDYSAALYKLPIASISTTPTSSDSPYDPNNYILSHIEYIDNFINSSRGNFASYAGVRKFGQATAGETYGNLKAVFKWNYKSKKAKYPFFDKVEGEQFAPSNVIQSLEFKAGQDRWNSIMSERMSQVTLKEMGAYALCTKYVNVFINGRYMGLRTMRDDFKQQNYAEYFGGDDEDYSKLDFTDGWWNNGGIEEGEGKKEILDKIKELRDKRNLVELKKLVQIDEYIKLVMMFCFNSAETESEAIGYNNAPEKARFRFSYKDTDWGFSTGSGHGLIGPALIHEYFGKSGTNGNLEYKTLAKDFVRQYMETEGAPMSESAFNEKTVRFQQEIEIVAKIDTNVNNNFMWFTNEIKKYMKNKVRDNINKWKNDGNTHTLFEILIETNNKIQENETIAFKNNNTLAQTYYSLDGTDPMGDNGANSNKAILYSTPFKLNPAKYVITVRPFVTNNWGPKTTKTIEIISNAPKGIFSITGINYNPLPNKDAEFLLISNPSNTKLDISSYAIADAITYKFPPSTELSSKETIILGKDTTLIPNNSFYNSLRKFQWEKGSLANEGEVITWNDANGNVVEKFTYGVAEPWEILANGKGYYLKLKSEGLDKSSHESWIATPINDEVSAGISGAVGA